MIDIHCHILYGVDDGARSYEESLDMLEDAAEQGITDIIATPHYRRGMFPYDPAAIRENFTKLAPKAQEYGINLRLGCEYHADSEMIYHLKQRRVVPLAGSDFVLTEFSSEEPYARIRTRLDELMSNGYIPVIAHAERCRAFAKDMGLLDEVRKMGARIQLNADSILGADGFSIRKICKKILKEDLADIVASDSHDLSGRCSRMLECMENIGSKYGDERAERLFVINPGVIVGK